MTPATMTQCKRGIRAVLLDGPFSQVLADLNREMADGLVVPALRVVKRAELKQITDMPAAELVGVRTLPTSQDGFEREHLVAMRFFVTGDDEELLTDLVERYVEAADRTFNLRPGDEARLWPWLPGVVSTGQHDYDPVMQHKDLDETLVKVGSIEVFVRTNQ